MLATIDSPCVGLPPFSPSRKRSAGSAIEGARGPRRAIPSGKGTLFAQQRRGRGPGGHVPADVAVAHEHGGHGQGRGQGRGYLGGLALRGRLLVGDDCFAIKHRSAASHVWARQVATSTIHHCCQRQLGSERLFLPRSGRRISFFDAMAVEFGDLRFCCGKL